MADEKTLWKCSASQAINFNTFVWCGLFFWLVIPLFIALARWLEVRNLSYEVTNQRIRIRSGILRKQLEEIELYRVRDSILDEPFILRQFKAGNIVLYSSDTSMPAVILSGVPQAEERREELRQAVEDILEYKRIYVTQ